MIARPDNLAAARAAWGLEIPPWVETLAAACDAENQTQVAHRLHVSKSTISLVLKNAYPAKVNAIRELVELKLGGVDCPDAGEQVAATVCMARRATRMPTGSRQAFRAWQSCQSCPQGGPS